MAYFECILYYFIPYGTLMFIFFFTPYGINKLIIKKRLLRQKESIQTLTPNRLLTAEHIFGIEWNIIHNMFFISLFFIGVALPHIPEAYVKEIICQIPFHIREDIVDWPIIPIAYYMIALTIFILLNLILLYIRRAFRKIQGAVLFDPKEKKVYVFPSIDSDNYKEYHESELTYTTESYWYPSEAYVFFTKKENDFAFKVDNLKYNDFNRILSQRSPIDISIPFKYRFHELIYFIFTIVLSSILFYILSP